MFLFCIFVGISGIYVRKFDDSVYVEYVDAFAQYRRDEEVCSSEVHQHCSHGITTAASIYATTAAAIPTASHAYEPTHNGRSHAPGQSGNAIAADSVDESNGYAIASYPPVTSRSTNGFNNDDSTTVATSAATGHSRHSYPISFGTDNSAASFADDPTPAAATTTGANATSATSTNNDSYPSAAAGPTAAATTAA